MGDSRTELPEGWQSSRHDMLLAMLLAFAAGVGLCTAFACGFWVRGLIDRDAGPPARPGPTLADVGRPTAEPLDRRRDVAARPEAEPAAPVPVAVAAPEPTPLDGVGMKRPIADAPRTGAPRQAADDAAPGPAAAERFALRDPPPKVSTPFILPDKPWFALADLALDDPVAGDGADQVCAVDRSLNTALTWAKSPAVAAETARRDGKLVFLIHVSGNFENTGFT